MWRPKKHIPISFESRTKKSYIHWICSMDFHMQEDIFTEVWQYYWELDSVSQLRLQREINRDKPVDFDTFKIRLKEYQMDVFLRRAQGILKDKWWQDKQEFYKKAGPIEGETTLDDNGQFGLEL